MAYEHDGAPNEGRQESVTEAAVDLVRSYIALQYNHNKPINHLFLEPTSKDVEKKKGVWEAFWGPI